MQVDATDDGRCRKKRGPSKEHTEGTETREGRHGGVE